MKLALFCQIIRLIYVFRNQLIFINRLEKSDEISFFATISHSCKGQTILCNHESWLQRIFFPLQLWLTVAKRLIPWDFLKNMAFKTPFFGKFYIKCKFYWKVPRNYTFCHLLSWLKRGKYPLKKCLMVAKPY